MPLISPLIPPLPKKASDRLRFGNLYGSSFALVVSRIAEQSEGPVLVVTHDNLAATRLEQMVRFFAPELDTLNFPDWETLPYDNFSPHQDIVSQRLWTLFRLPTLKRGVLIVPISTLHQRVPPRTYIEGNSFVFNRGDHINLDEIRQRLTRSGYRNVAQVLEHGEFAVRGSIIDLFPAGSELPFRIDLFDEEIDTIRTFDPESQRSIAIVNKIDLLPAREFPLTETAIKHFRQTWREKFSGDPSQCPIYEDVSQGFTPAGVEYYLPLFFEQTQTLLDYLPNNTNVIRIENVHQSAEGFWKEVGSRYEQVRYDLTRPVLAPNEIYLPVEELFALLNNFARIDLQAAELEEGVGKFNFATAVPLDLTINNKAEQPYHLLQQFLMSTKSRVLFCAETPGRREVLLDLLTKIQLQPTICSSWQEFLHHENEVCITVAPLEQGWCCDDPLLTLIAESQLFGYQVMQRRRRKIKAYDSDAVVRNLAELTVGSPVVHIDHGVGRYLGLQTIDIDDVQTEFLTLEYAGGDKLYVPVSSLHLISRYSGVDLEHAPLHRLGSEQWDKAKTKAAEQVSDVAVELLDLYARRAAREGYSFKLPETAYNSFAAGFPFEETPDQQQAIEQVVTDMTAGKPMDRLICGDVGFGKTEVAMRAAFIAVQDGKQVAVLVPTTLLAQQHYQNFKDRFAEWPVNIEVVSRFRSTKEQTEILQKVKEGKIDILIGTHRLIQKDVQFQNLGLLIIDEEHRFGVQQKEKLKALRAEVDILTLTATPIPRTLNMAFSGLREFSIIATPPARRLSIRTFVRERNKSLIREAILRELLRGGQVFFLHNEVQDIERIGEEINLLVPEARIGIAHGQMRERELEKIMADFYHQRFNVLVCTTIIETGIDIPTANTIIIDRADKFGLAQLHQLRGRVGRSHHQAYAYLMTPPKKQMTGDATKRLEAIASLEDLGAGFTLATHDLEIRGAGELLGEDQSGNIQSLGFSLYMELLEHAVDALKAGKDPHLEKPLRSGTEIDLRVTALIPSDYIPDVHSRLIFYKRIANAKDLAALQELQAEMIDRFGLLPQTTKNLFQITELKQYAQALGIRKIDAASAGGRIEFEEKPNLNPMALIQLIQKQPKLYKLDGPNRLRFNWQVEDPNARITQTFELIEKFAAKNA